MSDWTPDTWGELVAVLAVITAVVKVLDWRIRSHIDSRLTDVRDLLKHDIEQATKPIRPGHRNGGESLADVAHELRALRTHLGLEES